MKLSFTTLATPGLNGTEVIKLAKKFGYGGVDLRVSNNKGELTERSTDSEIRQLRNTFDSEGIKPSGLFCYNVKAGYKDATWQDMVESILRNMEIAFKLGSPSIRVFAGNPRDFENGNDYIKRTAETINEVLYKHDSGIVIMIQNHDGGFTFMHTYEAIKIAGNPRFKIAFSPDHCLIENEDMNDVYSKAKEISGQFYVADMVKSAEDGKFHTVFPGEGDVGIESAYKAIGGKDFDGWVTFKWERLWRPELEAAETVLPRFVEYFTRIYDSI
jgi:sugar phosphate isomerase/epimerase